MLQTDWFRRIREEAALVLGIDTALNTLQHAPLNCGQRVLHVEQLRQSVGVAVDLIGGRTVRFLPVIPLARTNLEHRVHDRHELLQLALGDHAVHRQRGRLGSLHENVLVQTGVHHRPRGVREGEGGDHLGHVLRIRHYALRRRTEATVNGVVDDVVYKAMNAQRVADDDARAARIRLSEVAVAR